MRSAACQATAVHVEATHPARFHCPELDVLRLIAFLGVFFFHAVPRNAAMYHAAGIPNWLATVAISVAGSGVYGVDLFFVLSAYLITTLLLRERETHGDVDVRRFYIRRILRIWPLYFSFIAFSALLSRLDFADQKLPFHYIAGFCLLAGNWVRVVYGGPSSVAAPLWTVSIEEQFYLIWPLAMRRATVERMVRMAAGILVLGSLYRAAIAASGASLAAMKGSTFSRIDPIALGILLAIFSDRITQLSRWQRVALLLSGWVTCIAVYVLCSSNTWRLALGYPVAALASAAILVSFLGSQHPFLKNRQLLYLGKISYGLYVIHEFGLWCAFHLVHASRPLTKVAELGLALALTLLFATASYQWLESPFLKLKERFSYVPSRPV